VSVRFSQPLLHHGVGELVRTNGRSKNGGGCGRRPGLWEVIWRNADVNSRCARSDSDLSECLRCHRWRLQPVSRMFMRTSPSEATKAAI